MSRLRAAPRRSSPARDRPPLIRPERPDAVGQLGRQAARASGDVDRRVTGRQPRLRDDRGAPAAIQAERQDRGRGGRATGASSSNAAAISAERPASRRVPVPREWPGPRPRGERIVEGRRRRLVGRALMVASGRVGAAGLIRLRSRARGRPRRRPGPRPDPALTPNVAPSGRESALGTSTDPVGDIACERTSCRSASARPHSPPSNGTPSRPAVARVPAARTTRVVGGRRVDERPGDRGVAGRRGEPSTRSASVPPWIASDQAAALAQALTSALLGDPLVARADDEELGRDGGPGRSRPRSRRPSRRPGRSPPTGGGALRRCRRAPGGRGRRRLDDQAGGRSDSDAARASRQASLQPRSTPTAVTKAVSAREGPAAARSGRRRG